MSYDSRVAFTEVRSVWDHAVALCAKQGNTWDEWGCILNKYPGLSSFIVNNEKEEEFEDEVWRLRK
jgi:hypothetical protein